MIIDVKRIIRRSFYYIRTGNAIGFLPITLFSTASFIYYSLVVNVSFLKDAFPNFIWFFAGSSFLIILYCGLLGYFWLKRSKFYKQEIEIGVETNPYSYDKIPPNGIPFWEIMVAYLEKQGEDCSDAKRILANSGSKKYGSNT